jgi:hypothetical protein
LWECINLYQSCVALLQQHVCAVQLASHSIFLLLVLLLSIFGMATSPILLIHFVVYHTTGS